VSGIEVFPVKNLTEIIAFLRSELKISPVTEPFNLDDHHVTKQEGPDISDVRGQEHAGEPSRLLRPTGTIF